jgi:YcxB-like protein
MIEFKGTLTRELYARGLRHHGTSPLWLGVLFVLFGALGVVSAVRTGAPWFVPLAIAAAGIYLILQPRIAAARMIRTNALIREGFTATADETGLTIVIPTGRSSIPWDKFYRWTVKPDMILLYVSAQQFLILPRTFFSSDSDWNQFQTLITQRVQARRLKSPLITALLWAGIVVMVS